VPREKTSSSPKGPYGTRVRPTISTRKGAKTYRVVIVRMSYHSSIVLVRTFDYPVFFFRYHWIISFGTIGLVMSLLWFIISLVGVSN